MYRDMPITPDSRCSVHSKVTCNRTSFFFDAAVTTSARREFDDDARCEFDDAALSADVLAMDVRAASMAASGCDVGFRACDRANDRANERRRPRQRATPTSTAMSDDARDADAARRIKIYTKTGDEGASCLYNMERRDKDDGAFAALGDVDECNVACGIAREFCVDAGNGLEGEVGARARERERRG